MKDLVKRLTSRKFLLALAACIVCVANGNIIGVVAVVLGYLGAQGVSDAITANKQ